MALEMKNGNVLAICPDCGTLMGFNAASTDSSPEHAPTRPVTPFGRIVRCERLYAVESLGACCKHYVLLSCSRCGRGAVAAVLIPTKSEHPFNGVVIDFAPVGIEKHPLPEHTPPGISEEFREAERCASVQAWRGGAALLRSTVEKILRDHNYDEGRLVAKIDAAGTDGLITEMLRRRAHNIKALGNDVLHSEWRKVTEAEFQQVYQFTFQIIEALYQDLEATKAVMAARLPRGQSPTPKVAVEE